MKRILSMLLALVMVISLIPVAASAAEVTVADGIYTTSEAGTKTFAPSFSGYTPAVDGVLTVTIGENTANWNADVTYSSGLSQVTIASSSGTGTGTFTAELTAGTAYRIRLWETNGGTIVDLPVYAVFTPSGDAGEEDTTITVKGEVATDTSENLMTGTDVAVTAASQVTHSFKASADGILTVHIKSASTGWKITGEGVASREGSGEAAVEYEVYEGQTYGITLGCYADWDWATGTISYDILFYETELAVEEEEYIIADKVITAVGEHTITMEENAKVTVVTFTPAETGIYKITAADGATVANCGGGSWFINTSAEFAESVEWTCEEVAGEYESDGETYTAEGQSLMVGIKSDAANVTLTVEKTRDYVVEEIPLITYENKALDVEVPVQGEDEEDDAFADRYNAFVEEHGFVLPEGATLGSYVNVSDTVNHTAVLGTDGYYHLDSVDGEVLLLDMDYQDIVLTDKLNSEIPTMYAYVTLDDGTEVKYDIAEAIQEYEAVCDENMYYPLTADLIFFYQTYATNLGIWIFNGLETTEESNPDAWLYCCRTVTLPADENATSGTLNISDGATVQWTAPATGTVQFTVTPSTNTVPIFLPDTYMPVLEITTGSGTLAVTEGVVYEIMDAYNGGSTVVWEYVEDSEGGDEGGDETVTVLSLGDNAVSASAGLGGGSWTYTATEAGTLSASITALTLVEPDYENEGQYVDNVVPAAQVTMVVGMQMSFQINGVDALNNTVQVNAGDVVTVQLSHRSGYEFRATINLALGEPAQGGEPDGSLSNPYVIESLPYSVEMAADDDVYYVYTPAEDCTLEICVPVGNYCSGAPADQGEKVTTETSEVYTLNVTAGVAYTINPWGANAGTFSVAVKENTDVPVEPAGPGTEEDPYIITAFPSETAVPLTESNMSSGIWYQYTATAAGKFAVDFPGFVNLKVNGNEVYFLDEVSVDDVILIQVGAWYSEEGVDYTLKIYDPTVAKIGDVVYTEFSTAIYNAVSGDTITLLSDVEVADVMVVPGVTLDLNGYTLAADYIAVFNGANIVDNSEANTGLLTVDENNVIITAGNAQMPVWNGSGYVLSAIDLASLCKLDGRVEITDDQFGFAFHPLFQTTATALLSDGAEDNNVTIEVRIRWKNSLGDEYRNFVYNEAQVKTVMPTANGAFTLTVTGLSAITDISDLYVEAVVRSNTGVCITSAPIPVTLQ